MKHIIFRLSISILTFAVSFMAVMLWFQSPSSDVVEKVPASPPCDSKVSIDSKSDLFDALHSPIFSFCELVNKPELYSGKIVRIRARLSGFIHGMVIADENRLGVDNQAAASYNQANLEEIQRVLNKARGSTDSMNWLEPVNIIAVGKFEKVTPSNHTDLIYDTAALRFEIISVEKATKLY